MSEIVREVERLNNEHYSKIQNLFRVEKQLLRDELYDDLLRALRGKVNEPPERATETPSSVDKNITLLGDKFGTELAQIIAEVKNVVEGKNGEEDGDGEMQKSYSTGEQSKSSYVADKSEKMEPRVVILTMNEVVKDGAVRLDNRDMVRACVADKGWDEKTRAAERSIQGEVDNMNKDIDQDCEFGGQPNDQVEDEGCATANRAEHVDANVGKRSGEDHNEISEEALRTAVEAEDTYGGDDQVTEIETTLPRKKTGNTTSMEADLEDIAMKKDSEGTSVVACEEIGGNEELQGNEVMEEEIVDDPSPTKPEKRNKKRHVGELLIEQAGEEVPGKRVRKLPSRYGFPPKPKPETNEKVEKTKDYRPLARVDNCTIKKFKAKLASDRGKEYVVNGFPVEKSFFRVIYTPKNHINSQHMESLLSLVWRQLGEKLLLRRIAVLDTWFTQMLVTDYQRYENSKDKKVFVWNSVIKNYVRGNMPSRRGNIAWMKDVDLIYAPMHWAPNHWVALVVNLRFGNILILDPLIIHTDDRKLPAIMKPIVDMFPLILRDLVPSGRYSYRPPDRFEYQRLLEVSQNERTGDCGPLTAKFIELHSQGISLTGMTDKTVDHMRMKFAIDVYEEFVVAL